MREDGESDPFSNADLAAGLDFAALQEKRKCGTSCGSCRPELHRLVSGTEAVASSAA